MLLLIYASKLLISKIIQPEQQNAYAGIHYLYISVLLCFASYKCAVFGVKSSVFTFLLFVSPYLFVALIINIAQYHRIKKGVFLQAKPDTNRIVRGAYLGSIAAFIASRVFFRSISQDGAYIALSIVIYMLALIMLFGCGFLHKYYWQRKLNL